MSEGLMWWPDEGEDFIDEIERAAKRFYERFGERPTACRMRGTGILKAGRGITVIWDETILPGHFLLTTEEVRDGKV